MRFLTHKGHSGHTVDSHGSRRRTSQPSLTPSRPTKNPQTHTRTTARRARSPPSQRSSPPNPAADSEKTTPSEPDPADSTAPRAPPRACSKAGARRNEGARSRCVLAAGSAAGTPNELESREAEAGECHGGGEATSLKLGCARVSKGCHRKIFRGHNFESCADKFVISIKFRFFSSLPLWEISWISLLFGIRSVRPESDLQNPTAHTTHAAGAAHRGTRLSAAPHSITNMSLFYQTNVTLLCDRAG